MKRVLTALTLLFAPLPALAEETLPSLETGKGETIETFLDLCVKPESSDFRSHVERIRKSGWTIYYEDALSKDGNSFEAAASSTPGDECSLHLTLEQTSEFSHRCEVIVSRFCSRNPTSAIRESVMDELVETQEFTFDPVSTADENRRMSTHEHHVYRSVSGDGPLVRLADTGGSLFLSATSYARDN